MWWAVKGREKIVKTTLRGWVDDTYGTFDGGMFCYLTNSKGQFDIVLHDHVGLVFCILAVQ